jgi:hypothetical protein
MITLDRVSRSMLAIVLASAVLAQDASAQSTITPSHGVLTYPSGSSEGLSSFLIDASDGTPAYVISLQPDVDANHHVVVLTLVLHRPGDRADAPNLLDPTGKVHGYQRYTFAASDFEHGVKRSAYGERRTIDLARLGMEVRIRVNRAAVRVIPPSAAGISYEFDELALRIDVRR